MCTHKGSTITGSIIAMQGDNVKITCASNSKPASTYQWTLPDASTRSGNQFSVTDIQPSMRGQYTLMVWNFMSPTYFPIQQGKNSTTLTVDVLVPIANVTLSSANKSLLILDENETTTFQCDSSPGNPSATVQWFKDNGTPDNLSDDIEITSGATNQILSDTGVRCIINYSAARSDSGMSVYCTANNVGTVIKSDSSPTLIILSNPRAPYDLQTNVTTSESIRLSWRHDTLEELRNSFVIEVSKKDTSWQQVNVKYVKQDSMSNTVSTELTELQESTTYSVRVFAKTVYGTSSYSEIASFVTSTMTAKCASTSNQNDQPTQTGVLIGSVIGACVFGLLVGVMATLGIQYSRSRSRGEAETHPYEEAKRPSNTTTKTDEYDSIQQYHQASTEPDKRGNSGTGNIERHAFEGYQNQSIHTNDAYTN